LRGLQIIASKAPEYKELIAKKLVEKVNLSEIDFKVSFVR
jgi:hypothetical protein